MAYLSPLGNEPQINSNGAPLSGGFIYTYLAGTTTPAATYTASDGITQQVNPIVLNSSGLPSNPIWLGAGVAMKLVFKDSNNVTLRTVDNVLGVNDPSGITAQDEWVTYSGTPTFVSATSFSVSGDQTSTFQVSRRVKSSNSGGLVYSRISASSYNAGTGLTTVTVVNDSGTLDSGLSTVSYGLLSVTNPSIPETSVVRAARTTAAGVVVDRQFGSYATNADITSTIPLDDTIPQNTEGTQIISVSLTPKSATNRVRLRFKGQASAGAAINVIPAIFSSASANALAANVVSISGAGFSSIASVEHEYVPGVTTALTFTVRIGSATGATFRMNGSTAARFFGGVSAATLVVEEIAV